MVIYVIDKGVDKDDFIDKRLAAPSGMLSHLRVLVKVRWKSPRPRERRVGGARTSQTSVNITL